MRKVTIMHHDPNVTAKAKKYLRRFRFSIVLIMICGVSLNLLILYNLGLIPAVIYICIFVFFSNRLTDISRIKLYLSVLYKNLDADAYLEMVYLEKADSPSAHMRLFGEYYCGNYQNVVSICNKKLSDHKTHKYSRFYLLHLANVYFDLGDDEKLQQVLDQYKTYLTTLKPKEQAVLKKNYTIFNFFDSYLHSNTEEALSCFNKPPTTELQKIGRIFLQARLDIVDGNEEQARERYEYLAKTVPQLNYGKLAILTLEKLNHGESLKSAADLTDILPKVINDEDVPVFRSYYRTNRIISNVLFTIGTLILIASLALSIWSSINYRSYEEELRIMVEKDYDGVTVLDTFILKCNNTVVDSMFICETDNDILVCASFYYSGEDIDRYEVLERIPKYILWTASEKDLYHTYSAVTSKTKVTGRFCTDEAALPSNYHHLSSFNVDGKTVYYVVTSMSPTNQNRN